MDRIIGMAALIGVMLYLLYVSVPFLQHPEKMVTGRTHATVTDSNNNPVVKKHDPYSNH